MLLVEQNSRYLIAGLEGLGTGGSYAEIEHLWITLLNLSSTVVLQQ